MTYREFESAMLPFPVFSLEDVRLAFPSFDRRRLLEWQQKGYLTKVRRGHYRLDRTNTATGFDRLYAANKVYQPSYISLESALSWHGLIPEGVFTTTSITPLNGTSFQTPLGNFTYRHVHTRLYFGFQAIRPSGVPIRMAEAEKALIDLAWLRKPRDAETWNAWRINPVTFQEKVDIDRLRHYLSVIHSPMLTKRIRAMLNTMQHDFT